METIVSIKDNYAEVSTLFFLSVKIWRGFLFFLTTSPLTTISSKPSITGSWYIVSSKIFSNIDLKPLAPVLFLIERSAILERAS